MQEGRRDGEPEDHPLVVVISAWHDDDGVRARVAHGIGGPRRSLVCRSLPHLLGSLESLLRSWDSAGDRDPDQDR